MAYNSSSQVMSPDDTEATRTIHKAAAVPVRNGYGSICGKIKVSCLTFYITLEKIREHLEEGQFFFTLISIYKHVMFVNMFPRSC